MAWPHLSISEVTTYAASVEADILAYSEGGATGIGLWEYKLDDVNDDDVFDALKTAGLRATVCVGKVPSVFPDTYFTEPADPAERLKAMCAGIEHLAKFAPAVVLCVTGDPTGRDSEEMRRVTVEGLTKVARFASDVGVTLGIEPYRAGAGSLVVGLPATVALADDINEPNVGVIADSWHLWDQPNIEDDLRRYVHRIVGVQVCDRRVPCRGWADRRFPGDGLTNLASFVGALDAAGYSGWYDVEIFSDNGPFGDHVPDSIWDLAPLDAARQAVSGFQKVWQQRLQGPSH